MTVSIGLIGAGNISKRHLPAYRDYSDRLQLKAVCDKNTDAAETIADEFDIPIWEDFEVFVEEADIDAVDITLPHYLHYPAAKAALNAGKHVLVEKPFATSISECKDLVERADENDLRLMVGQTQRYYEETRSIKSLLEDDYLGQIHSGSIDSVANLHDYVDPPHWLYDGEKAGGGAIISNAVHRIDLLRYFIGDAHRAIGIGKTVDPAFEDAEDYFVGIIEFENGAMVDLFSTYSGSAPPFAEGYWLFGEDAALTAIPEEGEFMQMQARIGERKEEGALPEFRDIEITSELPADSAFSNQLLHFADCISEGTEPLSSGKDNIGTMGIIFALYESMDRNGEPVTVEEVLSNP